MNTITLGTTGIQVPQNGFGALPIQRVTIEQAVRLLRKAYQGGIRYFDTARAYSDSEEKIGAAFAADSEENIGAAFAAGQKDSAAPAATTGAVAEVAGAPTGKNTDIEAAGAPTGKNTDIEAAGTPTGQGADLDISTLLTQHRDQIYIATKTHATTPEGFWQDLETSLSNMHTAYIDVYQFHQMDQCFRPGDGTGMYECMLEAKKQGKIHHIGATTHKIGIAEEIVASGLYETLQYPFSYLASERDIALVKACREHHVGFIAMKGLAGGLINHSDAAMAFMTQYDNVLPIWGIQRESELQEWLSYMDQPGTPDVAKMPGTSDTPGRSNAPDTTMTLDMKTMSYASGTPVMTPEIAAYIAQEKKELSGNFCRGCGYCMPCTVGITINQCNRMSLMLRRAPSKSWLTPHWQEEMAKIDNCINCRICTTRCPYELDIPKLLKENLADYRNVLAGKVSVD